jgi:transcriptional regulator with XRE-family HTH domain
VKSIILLLVGCCLGKKGLHYNYSKGKLVDRMHETMHGIDKAAFGEFLSRQRKELGCTQKELAKKLFVSDKAVSKWERGLSLPDISLLIPLAAILEVSVTELLEGKKIEQSVGLEVAQVDVLVKKALAYSEESPEKRKARKRKNIAVFCGCTLLAAFELFIGIWYLQKQGISIFSTSLIVYQSLSFSFGIYAYFFMKDQLPAYYDENKISSVSSGIFHMNLPGICFNNSNWPYIVGCLQKWSIITMVILPVLCVLSAACSPGFWWDLIVQNAGLILYLTGLFVPLYITGKKYES